MTPRPDGRSFDELRPISIERAVNLYAEGSALISWGNNKVMCTASIEEKVPSFVKGSGGGWLTAEYAMLPRATGDRTPRDSSRGKINGRGSEIQRLIGRALRSAVDLSKLGERTIWIDCDVLQADGGTRTASITGAYVALVDSLRYLRDHEFIETLPIKTQIAAVSVGKVEGDIILDLCYEEDKNAEVDANFVMNSSFAFAELQGTGEGGFFTKSDLQTMLDVANIGVEKLFQRQLDALQLAETDAVLFDALHSRHC